MTEKLFGKDAAPSPTGPRTTGFSTIRPSTSGGGPANPGQPPTEPRGGGANITVSYEPRPGLGWLSIKNYLLNLITLTIYRFWAKTNIRKHVWSCIKINGEPLEYTGTGMELFLGAMIVLFGLIVPFIAITQWLQIAGYAGWALVVQMVFTLLFILLFGMAIYRARRYRLSRTLWRGVRGALEGSSVKYSLLYFGTTLLASVTLGWSNPAMNLELQERITKNMKFGETPFGFRGTAGPLYGRYAIAWFLSLFAILALSGTIGYIFADSFSTLAGKMADAEKNPKALLTIVAAVYGGIFVISVVFGIIWSFYTAYEMAKFASYTYFDNATFRFNATGPSLIGLWLGNLLIMIFTLGIAAPYTVQRTIRYFVDRLDVDGWVDISKIEQSRAKMDSRGEGLLDAFDIDGI